MLCVHSHIEILRWLTGEKETRQWIYRSNIRITPQARKWSIILSLRKHFLLNADSFIPAYITVLPAVFNLIEPDSSHCPSVLYCSLFKLIMVPTHWKLFFCVHRLLWYFGFIFFNNTYLTFINSSALYQFTLPARSHLQNPCSVTDYGFLLPR